MGAIAESITAYTQPLLDGTDGSIEQMNHALMLGQACWNLALLPEEARDKALREMGPGLKMEAAEFDVFRRTVIVPMIQRHEEMFPRMHGAKFDEAPKKVSALPAPIPRPVSTEKYPGTGRNAPCPCSSGKKYKKCCGQ